MMETRRRIAKGEIAEGMAEGPDQSRKEDAAQQPETRETCNRVIVEVCQRRERMG